MTEATKVLDGAVTIVTDETTSQVVAVRDRFGNDIIPGVVYKSVFPLNAHAITLTDDPGVGQHGSISLMNFPAGNIVTLGAVVNAGIILNEAWWVDTVAGGVGLGTVAVVGGGALTGTEQNIINVTAIAPLVLQAGPINAQSTSVCTTGLAGGTDAILNLNVQITDDPAHMPDVVTNGAFTGAATGWTLGAGWAYGTNDVAATTASTALSQAVTLVAGVAYSLTYTTTRAAGSVRPTLGGTLGTARSTANTFTETITPVTTSGLSFIGTGFTGTIDTVSVTPLTGTGSITGTVTVVWTNTGDF